MAQEIWLTNHIVNMCVAQHLQNPFRCVLHSTRLVLTRTAIDTAGAGMQHHTYFRMLLEKSVNPVHRPRTRILTTLAASFVTLQFELCT
jgi:hypothetical protein